MGKSKLSNDSSRTPAIDISALAAVPHQAEVANLEEASPRLLEVPDQRK